MAVPWNLKRWLHELLWFHILPPVCCYRNRHQRNEIEENTALQQEQRLLMEKKAMMWVFFLMGAVRRRSSWLRNITKTLKYSFQFRVYQISTSGYSIIFKIENVCVNWTHRTLRSMYESNNQELFEWRQAHSKRVYNNISRYSEIILCIS